MATRLPTTPPAMAPLFVPELDDDDVIASVVFADADRTVLLLSVPLQEVV